MQRLKSLYVNNVVPILLKKFGYKNIYQVPKIKKIIINRGFDDTCQGSKILDILLSELSLIAGQRVYLTRAKKAIANFKVRENTPVGMAVTLRGDRMYSFFDRLVNLALPRIRDFQGLNKRSFDKFGNYSLGLSEQSMFPEIEFDKVNKVKGMDIVLVTNAKTKEEAFFLLKELGMPFRE
uniref:ribosomal protein L5 n=1 Tax=Phacus arnoldii TaxID=298292 RepID=UPI0023AA7418|nr:ribosomal protein L5 [Phacus arnoldii]WCH63568.1 ribosomal protein L5 [Phacus arnoldii]